MFLKTTSQFYIYFNPILGNNETSAVGQGGIPEFQCTEVSVVKLSAQLEVE